MTFIHKIKERPFLITSIVLLILLRVLFLTGDSLCLDETFSVVNAQQAASVIIEEHINGTEPNAPFYPLLLKTWMTIFGNSERAVRSLSLLFSFLTAIVLYKGVKNQQGTRAAEWILFLFALSPPLLYFSQEVRAYGLFLFLLSLFFQAANDFTRKGVSLRNGSAIALSLWGMILSHPFGWFVAGWGCFLYVVHTSLKKRLPSPKELIAGAITLIPIIIYFFFFMAAVSKQQEGFWIKVPGLKHLLGGIHFQAGSFPLLWIYAVLFFRWIQTKGYKEKERSTIVVLLGYWSLFTLVPFVLSQFIQPIYTVRYTVYSTLFMLIIVVMQLIRESQKVQIIFAVLIALFGIQHWTVSKMNATREQWREISQKVQPSVPIVGGTWFIQTYPLTHYLPTRDFSKDYFIDRETMDDDAWMQPLDSFLLEKDSIQVLTSHFGDGNTEKVMEYLEDHGWSSSEEFEWFFRDQNNQKRSSAQWFLLKKQQLK